MSPLLVLFVSGVASAGGVTQTLKSNGSIITADNWRASTNFSEREKRQDILQSLVEGFNSQHGSYFDDSSGNHSATVAEMCPRVTQYVRDVWCYNISTTEERTVNEKPTPGEVWGLGFLFVTIINCSSVFGVVFLPLMSKKFYKQLLVVMVGLAVGSLSSSSVFHLIPQALNLTDDPHHAYLNISLMVWMGIWVFFLVERFLRIIAMSKQTSSHCPVPRKDNSDISTPSEEFWEAEEYGHSHGQTVHFQPGKDSVISTVAWMVIFGDGFHNFIDGLSIGAAFNESPLTGVSISVAVLCEELPHELGDFAVLLSAGMTMRQALLYNFLSACTCYVGLVVGIFLGEFDASVYVFGFAGGMFLYISLVDMMPEMNAAAEDAVKRGRKHACKMLLLQNVGLLSGMALLFSLARFQDRITFW